VRDAYLLSINTVGVKKLRRYRKKGTGPSVEGSKKKQSNDLGLRERGMHAGACLIFKRKKLSGKITRKGGKGEYLKGSLWNKEKWVRGGISKQK